MALKGNFIFKFELRAFFEPLFKLLFYPTKSQPGHSKEKENEGRYEETGSTNKMIG